MSFFGGIKDVLDSGDPVLRTWFLMNTYFWPASISAFYLLFVRRIGPALMKNHRPIELRYLMFLYNMLIVAAYINAAFGIIYHILVNNLFHIACQKVHLDATSDNPIYKIAICVYHIYLLKYVELFDTVFIVLRKKGHLATNLHIIHHASLPIVGWYLMRTEFSAYQIFPAVINSIIHIIMYSYYGLAALGATFRKHLWWKKYLTILQMVQFLIIILTPLLIVNIPGCELTKSGIYLDVMFGVLFLVLFYNFYSKTYNAKNKSQYKPADEREKEGKHRVTL